MWTTASHDVREGAATLVLGDAACVVGADVELGAPCDEGPTVDSDATAVVVGLTPGGATTEVAAERADDDREPSSQAPTIVSRTTSAAGMASKRGTVMASGR